MAVSGIAIQRDTLLRANTPAQSDHLGIVVDLDLKYLFTNACSPLISTSPRKLTSDNSTAVKKYIAFIQKQFQAHKIVERRQRLRTACDLNEFTEEHRQQLFALDKQVTEILLGAESRCSNKCRQSNMWSPVLKKSGQEICYLRQRFRTNGFLAERTRDLGRRIDLPASVQQTLTIPVCKFYLSIAWKTFNGINKQAREYRRKFQYERAKEQAAKGHQDIQKVIKQIRHKEQTKHAYASIRRGYGISKMGLATLDVPDPISGGRKIITKADEIHTYLLQRNEKHFGQATYTTFGDAGPGFKFIDPANPDSDEYIDAMFSLCEGVPM